MVFLMEDERDDIVVLVDENGDEVEFEHIDSFEMNDNEYVILAPLNEEIDEDEEEEVIILRVEHNEDGEDSYVTIEDDDELDEVFSEFQSRMDDEYEQ
jgi:uncharacterized protein YrzB (UPF0473 family)